MSAPTSAGTPTGRRPLPIVWLVAGLAVLAAVAIPIRLLAGRSGNDGGAAAAGQRPSSAASAASPAPAGDPPPACEVADVPARHARPGDWRRTLLDRSSTLPASFVPPHLVSTSLAGFDDDVPIREEVAGDLGALRRAAASAGNPLAVTFGYRSYEEQRFIFDYYSKLNGYDHTLLTAARPGHSEHQLGTALDFRTPGTDHVDQSWGTEPVGKWMRRNAWRYGFVLSYPRGQEDVTCYGYEPWHFRYFGRALAADIHASGLTTREYLWLHR